MVWIEVSISGLEKCFFMIDYSLHRSGEIDIDFVGNLETEEGGLPEDLVGAAGTLYCSVVFFFV